jgi:AcrR family transcriptional regulator
MSPEERKFLILKSVLPVFAKKGFDGATSADLAKSARISQALLYKYFPNKETLYRDLSLLTRQDSIKARTGLEDLEPSTEALVKSLYFLVRMIVSGKPGEQRETEDYKRMMIHSLLQDGFFNRTALEVIFYPFVEPIERYFEASEKAGDLVTASDPYRNRIYLSHHLAVGLSLYLLPKKPSIDHQLSETDLLRGTVLFVYRGIGLREEAIDRLVNFKKLEAWFEKMFEKITRSKNE